MWVKKCETRVWSNGTYDLLHAGHLELLKYAASLGYSLWVGIDGDKRVKALKGEGRPIENEDARAMNVYNLPFVSHVVLFHSDEELKNAVKVYKPHIMVIGDDYKEKKIIGSEYAKEVRFFKRLEGISTTNIIANL